MKTYTKEQLDSVLKNHKLWIESDKTKGEKANLSNANLSNANLSHANLFNADLSNANLSYANLYDVNLSNANLSNSNLRNANLSNANLSYDNLRNATLSNANLSYANLYNAILSNANLSYANLHDAILYNANLHDAIISGAELPNFLIVPQEGSFIAFKKLRSGAIAKLFIPEDAERINSLTSRGFRVSKAKVLEISNELKQGVDSHTGKLVYKIGEWVKPNAFNDDIRIKYTNGIHCYITRKEAEDHLI